MHLNYTDKEEAIERIFLNNRLSYSLMKSIREYKRDCYTTKEIAKALKTTSATVNNYVQRIRGVMGLINKEDG